jgi:hypothetical protein
MSARQLLVTSVLVLTMVLVARPARADDPNRVFAGQIITMSKRPPATAKSPAAYIATMRKMKQEVFQEDKSDHSWTIHFAAFLKSPLNDMEYSIKFYELSGHSGQQLLAATDQFTDARGEKTIVSKIKLDKKQVGVNKEVLMTLESKGKVLASSRFKLLGEGERFSGKVDFSDDDAAGKDDDDDAKKK